MLFAFNNWGPGTGGSFANPSSVLFGTTATTTGATGAAPNTTATIGFASGAGGTGGAGGTAAFPPIAGGSVAFIGGAGTATITTAAGFNNLSNPGGTAFGNSNTIIQANVTQCNTFGLLGWLTNAASGSNYLTCGFTPAATAAGTNTSGQFYMYLSYIIVNPF